MTIFKRLNPFAAVVDQMWLSLLSFAISLAFIWGGSKTEYGFYILLMAPLLLVQSIQNAVVNSPLATFLAAATEADKPKIRSTAASLHIYLALLCGLLGGVGLLIYANVSELQLNALLLAGFALAIVGTIARESQRSFAYVQGQGVRALAGDLVYGVVLLAGIALAVLNQQLTAGFVLLFTGIAGLVPLLPKTVRFRGLQTHAEPIRQFWSCGRWALPSVVVTWISLSSYPYFAEHALGLAAVAEIAAARLFLMPVGLLIPAWGNWYRPQISQLFSTGDVEGIKRITHVSLLVGLISMSLLAVVLMAAFPFFEQFLGTDYHGLKPIILMWLLFFSLTMMRSFYLATLLVDDQGYKAFHHTSWSALGVSLPAFIFLSEKGVMWVVGVLCIVELIQMLVVSHMARQYWRRLSLRAKIQNSPNQNRAPIIAPLDSINSLISHPFPREQEVSCTVAICTYKRPVGLRKTLDGLWAQRGIKGVTVVVVDNDAEGSARSVVEQNRPPSGWILHYVIELHPGVSHARNHALRELRTNLIAFIDDDEIPEPDWLINLLRMRRITGANAVFGPVLSRFEVSPPVWMSESATHNRPRFLSGAEIDWENSHAGNVLLDRTAISFGGGEFDSRFSTTGGEDTFFFASAKRMGAKLIWCDEAVVIEDVSPARMTLAWALRRSYKGGQTWVRVRTEFSMWLWPVMVLRGALSAFLAIAMLLPSLLISRGMAVRQAQRVAAGFGKMTAWWPLGGRRNGHYIG